MSRSRMFGDDGNPDAPSPRTTIVGGRPPEKSANLPPVPTGIQTLLRLAALDGAFRAELIEKRDTAATAAGVDLTPNERRVLSAVPEAHLGRMIDRVPAPPPRRRDFLRSTAASAVILLGGTGLAAVEGCKDPAPDRKPERTMSLGVTPDEPPPRAPAADAGAAREDPPPRPEHRETETDGGAAPEEPPPRPEHRETETVGGAAPHEPPPPPQPREPTPDAGTAPEEPPPRPDHRDTETEGGAAPDEPPIPMAGATADPPPPRPEHREVDTGGGAAPDEPPPTTPPDEPDTGPAPEEPDVQEPPPPRPDRPRPTRGARRDIPRPRSK